MREYAKHEAVPLTVEDPQPSPIDLMRELAALTEPLPLIDAYPSTLAVRRSRLEEPETAPARAKAGSYRRPAPEWTDEVEVKN